MALPTPADVQATSLTGAFATLTDAQIQLAIDEAALHYGSIEGIEDYPTIVALHAAHILALQLAGEGGGGGGGALQSVRLGPAAKTWAVAPVQVGDGVDLTTPYGRRLKSLLRTLLPAVRTTRPVPYY